VFNVGSQELLVVLLLVFLLFGPRHIPEVAHALGKGLGDLRRAIQGIEDNVRRAGGDLPRFPRDLDDLVDAPPARRPLTSVDLPAGPTVPELPGAESPADEREGKEPPAGGAGGGLP
jgi:TatA/E family protein of Tat protein translocase